LPGSTTSGTTSKDRKNGNDVAIKLRNVPISHIISIGLDIVTKTLSSGPLQIGDIDHRGYTDQIRPHVYTLKQLGMSDKAQTASRIPCARYYYYANNPRICS